MKFFYFLSLLVFISTLANAKSTHKIAILYSAEQAATSIIIKGFIDSLKQRKIDAIIDYYDNENDAQLAVASDYDILFATDTESSLAAFQACGFYSSHIPLIALADDPIRHRLIASLKHSGNNVTAIAVNHKLDELISILKHLITIKRALIMYSSTDCLKNRAIEFGFKLQDYNINTFFLEISNPDEILSQLTQAISGKDIIFILKDFALIEQAEKVAQLCNIINIPLFAFDLSAHTKGALLCYGVDNYQAGIEAGNKAIALLEEKKEPTALPSTILSNKLLINAELLEQYNSSLDERLFDFQLITVK